MRVVVLPPVCGVISTDHIHTFHHSGTVLCDSEDVPALKLQKYKVLTTVDYYRGPPPKPYGAVPPPQQLLLGGSLETGTSSTSEPTRGLGADTDTEEEREPPTTSAVSFPAPSFVMAASSPAPIVGFIRQGITFSVAKVLLYLGSREPQSENGLSWFVTELNILTEHLYTLVGVRVLRSGHSLDSVRFRQS